MHFYLIIICLSPLIFFLIELGFIVIRALVLELSAGLLWAVCLMDYKTYKKNINIIIMCQWIYMQNLVL
jgi:hypothetical protein